MRVAHLGKYAFLRVGGVERHVVDLTTALAARGVDVTVFSYDRSGSARSHVLNGVRVEPVPAWVTLGSQSLAPSLITRMRRVGRTLPYDIVHQHWPDPFAHAVASMAGRLSIQVVTWHADIVRQGMFGSLYRAVARHSLVRPDAIVGATAAHLESTQLDYFAAPERRHVIPFGIDVRPFSKSDKVLRGVELLRERYKNKPIVFSLGRHVYYKGFEVLVRAMSRVPATLLLGGEGPLTPQLREIAATSDGNVEFVGRISDRDLPVYYHAADVFCFPSVARTEAFGLAQAEAMACAKPVVNTMLGNGVNELAPHEVCALTVSPGDEIQLADALCRILSDRALAERLGVAGRKRVLTGYTVDAMVSRTLELYEMLLSGRQVRG